jgi:3-methyl-2-oxobutanoate hydroxymethyltransferase
MDKKKFTILDWKKLKEAGTPITVLTAYDYSAAALVDKAGVDSILVGDSLGMVMLGYDSTVSVTMADMLHHCKAVARGTKYAFLIGDMPFMSYQADTTEAVRNAGRFLQEGGMDAVKLEGGHEMAATIEAIVNVGIPVMGHLGLTPQTATSLGGYRVQGKTAVSAKKMLEDALILQEAGCFAVVLEAVPAPVATVISKQLAIPTIGIGAGVDCDGQVLVYHDMLGMFDRFTPKFVKQYANTGDAITTAIATFCTEVQSRQFPAEEHTYNMDQEELDAFLREVA